MTFATRLLSHRLLLLAGLLFTTACGGSGGGDQQPPPAGQSALTSVASMDGAFNPLAQEWSTAVEPAVGDDANNNGTWGFVTFDLSTLPAGAVIRSARLEVWQRQVEGDAFAVVNLIVVDHMEVDDDGLDWFDLLANELEAPITNGGGQALILSSNVNLGVRDMDVTRQVRSDRTAARRYAQFRLRGVAGLPTANSQPDRVLFTDGENQRGGQAPLLVVDWER